MVVALSLFIYGCTNTPSADEHPTKEEWLDVYITHCVSEMVGMWKQRVVVSVTINSKEQMIVVGITPANGEEEIDEDGKDYYIDYVEGIVEGILKEYDWAKSYKLTVQYI